MNLLTLLLQTTDTLVTPPVLTPTVETAGDLNLWELACKGGIIMIPLLLLSLLSIYIFFERLQVIRRAAREDNTFMERIKDYIHEGDIDSALKLCKKIVTVIVLCLCHVAFLLGLTRRKFHMCGT